VTFDISIFIYNSAAAEKKMTFPLKMISLSNNPIRAKNQRFEMMAHYCACVRHPVIDLPVYLFNLSERSTNFL